MVDQLPDPHKKPILVRVSFVAILVGDEEKLLALALVVSFCKETLRAWTGQSE